MFLMYYLSTNINNPVAYQKELDDLYGIMATNIDPDSDFELAGLEAVSPDSKTNYIHQLEGTLHVIPFEELMSRRPEGLDVPPEKQLLWKK